MPIRVSTCVLVAFWLASCHNAVPPVLSSSTTSGPYDAVEWVGGHDHNLFSRLEDTIAKADIEFYMDGKDMLKKKNSMEPPFALPRSETSKLASSPLYPGFIVVQLHKLAQIEDVDMKVSCINDFFFSHGADRVLVTGFRAMGRTIYSDKIRDDQQAAPSNP